MTPEGRSSRMDEGLAWDVVPYVNQTSTPPKSQCHLLRTRGRSHIEALHRLLLPAMPKKMTRFRSLVSGQPKSNSSAHVTGAWAPNCSRLDRVQPEAASGVSPPPPSNAFCEFGPSFGPRCQQQVAVCYRSRPTGAIHPSIRWVGTVPGIWMIIVPRWLCPRWAEFEFPPSARTNPTCVFRRDTCTTMSFATMRTVVTGRQVPLPCQNSRRSLHVARASSAPATEGTSHGVKWAYRSK